MKCEEITSEQEQAPTSTDQVYQFSVAILARSATRLSPFKMEHVTVELPCVNAITGNVRQLMLKGMGDTSQLLHVVVDVAMFHSDEMKAIDEVLGTPTVNVIGLDGTLNLVDPQIKLAGSGTEWN
ncbi:hypothetical protein GCM10011332_32210 [Terasakiella brassicae]|uniref:Uncharacterized protein n=1 Tax=Terasakiella brassicae TaxID=1634917 RepID=A0A917C8I1_9PROT|nr:hypothetical protein [Terasakiella brassicae]GGF75757.1 hypothetical protein GCM10011332_32210 [Terasakiella brassicae]